MSNNNAPWWIALIAWMSLATYWHVCGIKELCESSSAYTLILGSTAPLYIVDGGGLNLQSKGNFAFVKSGADPDPKAVLPELDSLRKYLLMNPARRVRIVGYYSSAEVNSTSYPDVGIARAEGVKRFLVGNGVPDSLLSTDSQLKNNLVFEKDSLRGGIEFIFQRTTPMSKEDLV